MNVISQLGVTGPLPRSQQELQNRAMEILQHGIEHKLQHGEYVLCLGDQLVQISWTESGYDMIVNIYAGSLFAM